MNELASGLACLLAAVVARCVILSVGTTGGRDRAVTVFARSPNGGLIMVGPPSSVTLHRNLIIRLATPSRTG
jgi:hypothetical protein